MYFTPGTYAKLKSDAHALQAVIEAIQGTPGVAHVYQAEELDDRPATRNPIRAAEAAGFFKSRSGDLIIVPKPYWIWDYSAPGKPSRSGGTSHGTPYYYDQRVPVILMGSGIRPGKFYERRRPPTLRQRLRLFAASRWLRRMAGRCAKPLRRLRPRRRFHLRLLDPQAIDAPLLIAEIW